MIRMDRLASVLLLASLLPSAPAMAAAYCLQTEAIPPQCIYDDPGECSTRAAQLNGWCTSHQTLTSTAGSGRFCLLINGAASCTYIDQGICMRDAAQQHGACITAPSTATRTPGANPYANRALLPGG